MIKKIIATVVVVGGLYFWATYSAVDYTENVKNMANSRAAQLEEVYNYK